MASNRAERSLMKLILVSAGSITVTLLLVFLLALPSIYGIDPTGFGVKLELNRVSSKVSQQAGIDTGKDTAFQTQGLVKTNENAADQPSTGAQGEPGAMPGEHQETFTLVVPPKQNLVFKFAMERDYELDYHWTTDGKPLYAELRGQKQTATDNEFKVFGKLKESKAKGFFIAPFNGNFSMYWENKTDQTVKVRLTAKGVYKDLT
jgi:hypothetical protein